MAKTQTIDPAKIYRVELARTVQIGRRPVHPGPNVRLRGDVLQTVQANNAGAVTDYELVK